MSNDIDRVTFLIDSPPYNKGEGAAFPSPLCDEMEQRGIARRVEGQRQTLAPKESKVSRNTMIKKTKTKEVV